MKVPKDIEVFLVQTARSIARQNYWEALDYLAKIELRVFKLAMAEMRKKEKH